MKTKKNEEGVSAPSSLIGNNTGFPGLLFGRTGFLILRIIALGVIDAVAVAFFLTLIANGRLPLGILIVLITIGLNFVFFMKKLYSFRWFAPGLMLMLVMMAYPTAYTIYMAFTNYGDGHLLTKMQVIEQLEKKTWEPEGAEVYSWTAFRSAKGEYVLWLQSDSGRGFMAEQDKAIVPAEDVKSSISENLDSAGIPEGIEEFKRLNRIEVIKYLDEISALSFGSAPETVRISGLDSAQKMEPRYRYNSETDTLYDIRDNVSYKAVEGTFAADDGTKLSPGYYVGTGAKNFSRLFTSPALRGPFIKIFIWTFVFAGMSVLLTFSVGLFFALVFNHPGMPARKIFRSLLLIPYAIPAFISVNVWRGMLNPHIGIIPKFLESVFGASPLWLSDPFWAKFGILVVQTWLGFPYMMLICTGALQSIPGEIYEAAKIDGAPPWRQLINMTLPMLLVAVGPLLIASFAFNFNNFTVIDIYAEGGPPIANSPTPAGHTDILITYIFRLAFQGGRGSDFGYASAITIIIFLIIAVVTALQFRYTKVWEDVSKNV